MGASYAGDFVTMAVKLCKVDTHFCNFLLDLYVFQFRLSCTGWGWGCWGAYVRVAS